MKSNHELIYIKGIFEEKLAKKRLLGRFLVSFLINQCGSKLNTMSRILFNFCKNPIGIRAKIEFF